MISKESVAQRHAILAGPDDLDQLVLGDRVARLATEDVVEAGLRRAFIAEPQEVLEGIGDPPARKEIDRDVELVLGGHVRRIAVPLENPLVDRIDLLDEGNLELQAGGRHGLADRLSELGDDHLLDFAHHVDGAHREVDREAQDREDYDPLDLTHGCAPFWAPAFSNGRMLRASSSTMIFERMPGITSCIVSR
jgi:hypothetical protein